MPATVIVNARWINEARQTAGGLRLENGRIATWVNGRMGWNGEQLVGMPKGPRLESDR